MQRLGCWLELVAAKPEIILLLRRWVAKHKPRTIPLRSDKDYAETPSDSTWRLYINDKIEADI